VGTAISTALKPEKFAEIAIGGILGNRVDAGFVKGFNGLIRLVQGGSPNDQQELQRAIGRSMIAAQQSIVKDCLRSAGLSEADRGWLQERRRELDLDLKELVNLPQERVLIASGAIDGVALGQLLLPQDADETRLLELRGQLVKVAELPGAPVVYLELVRSSFFERVCGCFGVEVRGRSELRDLLELQLLGQIGERMLTIDDLTETLQKMVLQPLENIDRRLANLQTDITDIKERLKPSMSLSPPNNTVLQPNPFVPFNVRIDNPSQFFPQDKVISRVFETLKSGSSVALIGEGGIGKSSLLKEIERLAPDRLGRKAIYIDWNLIGNEDTFWEMVCALIGVKRFHNTQLIRELQSRRLLLLLDEVERMPYQEFGAEIRSQLRGFAQDVSMKVVVTARVSLDVPNRWGKPLFSGDENIQVSPFAGLCTEERMLRWSEDMMRDYIGQKLYNYSIRFTATDIEKILKASQGNPQRLVQYCYHLYCKYRDDYESR
jgi:energy-coupling factor transporter ATP-binding protein EcfA2